MPAHVERSPSPPSRSQPLRALVDCGGYQDPQDRNNVAFLLAEDDDHADQADMPRTPERGRKQRQDNPREHRGPAPATPAPSPPSTLPLPRVADLDAVQRIAQEKQRVKAAEAAALVKNSANTAANAPNNGHGRTALYHPSWYETSVAAPDTSVPDSGLALEYVHGYAGETPDVLGGGGGRRRGGGRRSGDFGGGGGSVGPGGTSTLQGRVGGARNSATRSTNVVWLRSGEIVFPAAAVVVIHDFEVNRQRFFTGHDEASLRI